MKTAEQFKANSDKLKSDIKNLITEFLIENGHCGISIDIDTEKVNNITVVTYIDVSVWV